MAARAGAAEADAADARAELSRTRAQLDAALASSAKVCSTVVFVGCVPLLILLSVSFSAPLSASPFVPLSVLLTVPLAL